MVNGFETNCSFASSIVCDQPILQFVCAPSRPKCNEVKHIQLAFLFLF